MTLETIINEMAMDISCDIYGDIYNHEGWAEEVYNLREKLKEANSLIEEMKEYLQDGGYLGQEAGLIYGCLRFLGQLEA